jgi:large subunit ribosomal protein L35
MTTLVRPGASPASLCEEQNRIMPKLKTRKTAAKRFKITATGKLMRRSTKLNHLMRKKSGGTKRHLIKGSELFKGDEKRISRMLGEGH